MADEETNNRKACGHSETDDCNCECSRKPLDVNKYATKKTIAQGMLDIALLTANASQLKYILQVGEKHEFYSLMLALISISIILQVTQAIIGAVLGTALNINKTEDQDNANKINNAVLGINVVVVAINIIISAFDIKSGDNINNSTESSADAFFRNGTFNDLNNSNFITSYNQLSDIDNWSVSNVSNPDMDNSKLYQDFVDVFNKIRKIYLSNQTANMDSSFVLSNDNVNEFMDKVFEKN